MSFFTSDEEASRGAVRDEETMRYNSGIEHFKEVVQPILNEMLEKIRAAHVQGSRRLIISFPNTRFKTQPEFLEIPNLSFPAPPARPESVLASEVTRITSLGCRYEIHRRVLYLNADNVEVYDEEKWDLEFEVIWPVSSNN